MVKIKVIGEQFDVSAKMVDSGVPFPNTKESWTRHNKFKVKVCKEKKCRSFDFYGSHADMEKGKVSMGRGDLKDAFNSFLSDATYGTMAFEEFCSELGYDEDSRTAEKVWKATQKSYEQAKELGFSDDELYTAVNELNEVD
jgi:hypothetical protein